MEWQFKPLYVYRELLGQRPQDLCRLLYALRQDRADTVLVGYLPEEVEDGFSIAPREGPPYIGLVDEAPLVGLHREGDGIAC